MKHLCTWLLSAAVLLSFSCTQDPLDSGSSPEEPKPAGHEISVEAALSELNAVLSDIDGETRAGNPRSVGTVCAVKAAEIIPATRSGETAGIENLVYIANFENGEGYAILAADDRLASVIVITEQGSLSPEQFAAVAQGQYDDTSDLPPIRPEVTDYIAALGSGLGTGGIGGGILPPPIITTYSRPGPWTTEYKTGPWLFTK